MESAIDGLIEKCGGQGGTPGLCPSGAGGARGNRAAVAKKASNTITQGLQTNPKKTGSTSTWKVEGVEYVTAAKQTLSKLVSKDGFKKVSSVKKDGILHVELKHPLGSSVKAKIDGDARSMGDGFAEINLTD